MAEDRKERLAALAARAKRTNMNKDGNEEKVEDLKDEKKLKFRNYSPKDSMLESTNSSLDFASKRIKIGDEESGKSALEKAILEAKSDANISSSRTIPGSDVTNNNLAPKKVNWDLKRDIQSKLDRLEKRTQKAIVSLLKERLEKEAENPEILVNENDID